MTIVRQFDAANAPPRVSAANERFSVRFGLRQLFVLTTFAAVAIWAAMSCSTTYHIYGAVDSVAWIGVVLCCALLSPLLLLSAKTRVMFGLTTIALVAFSIYQTPLTWRLRALQTEVTSVIGYVDRFKLQHGLYPTDLSGYEFLRPELASYIEYRNAYPTTSYEIRWHPIPLDGIAHWYGADYGYYYEDD